MEPRRLHLCPLPQQARGRFHDGQQEQGAAFELPCPACAAQLRVLAPAAAETGAAWFAALPQAMQKQIAEVFGLALRSALPGEPAQAWSAERRPVHLFCLACGSCAAETVLAFEFGERQPQRFVGQLLGCARL